MKAKKGIFLAVLSLLSISSLVACGTGGGNSFDDDPDKPLEIGDTVKEWRSDKDFDGIPLEVSKNNNASGEAAVVKDFGNDDKVSLLYTVKAGSTGDGYIGSDVLENPYFTEDDAKNGDIISLYVYVPADSNVASLQLQALPISRNNPLKGDLINIDSEKEDKWIRTVVSFDTLETLGGIRLTYTTVNKSENANFYVDDINITYGAETVETGYEYNDESLYQTYEDYFKVGACMSSNMLRNTTLRKIAKDNFNSLTAENEGKPEQILDQKACQELASSDRGAVAIKTSPFEKFYDWCEANHIGVRHHTFVWYSQTPAWFFTTDYTQNGAKADRNLMLERMDNFIRVTMETLNDRWPGLVYAIDVSNEAVENGAVRSNNNNWYSTVGKDFVYHAFKYASQYKADDQKLYYNDFSFDYQPSNCSFALNTLLKEAIEDGYIDGVGIQGHLDSNANMDNVMQDAKMIQEKGLECQITELDITINSNNDANLAQQKKAYKDITKRILEGNIKGETNVTALVVWGINDDASWKRSQYPLLFTDNYAKKPAYYGVLEAIDEVAVDEVE